MISKIEKKLDVYFKVIDELNAKCEVENLRIEYLNDVLEDISNYEITDILICPPSHYCCNESKELRNTLIEEIDLLGKDSQHNVEISMKINSELIALLHIVEKEELKSKNKNKNQL